MLFQGTEGVAVAWATTLAMPSKEDRIHYLESVLLTDFRTPWKPELLVGSSET